MLGLLALSGCGEATLVADWELRFAYGALRERAEVVEVQVIRGGCAGEETVFRAELDASVVRPGSDALPAGPYGFRARARDADCVWFASGCAEGDVPSRSGLPVLVFLEPVEEDAQCEANQCEDGYCDAAGASPEDGDPDPSVPQAMDAGTAPTPPPSAEAGEGGDAGAPMDAATDAAQDTPPEDTSPPDASAPMPDAGGPAPVPDAGPPCDDGVLGDNGHCYRHFPDRADWSEARQSCRQWGGDLVSFADASEERWVVGQFSEASRFWIGYTDAAAEGSWTWTDGTPAGYEHWGDGEPNNGNKRDGDRKEEDCAEYRQDRGNWDDKQCKQDERSRTFICER